ncbi:MAG TPA: M36 family metallopeptidase [Mycobacteriales bacterium]
MRRTFLGAACAALLIAGLAAGPARPAGAIVHHDDPVPAPGADPRVATVLAPTAAQRAAARQLTGTSIAWDSRFGTPRSVARPGGYLTGPAAGTPATVARRWVAGQRELFGLDPAEVAALALTRDHALPGTGTHVVTFTQVVDGVPTVHGGRLVVAVTRDGRVLSYTGNPGRNAAGLAAPYTLTPRDAVARTAGAVAPGTRYAPGAARQEHGYSVFAKGPFAAPQRAQRAVFLTGSGARPAYRVLFTRDATDAQDVVLDAATGAVLYRRSLVTDGAEGTVYPNFPGAPRGGTPVRVPFTGWVQPRAGVEGLTTFGNNADTYGNYASAYEPAGDGPRPVSRTGQFHFPYTQTWNRTRGQSYEPDLDPAATNLFWHHNRIHDEYYRLGFTEDAGNFQLDNHGRGGLGGDAVIGLVHAGAAATDGSGRNNAYFATMPDGVPSWSGMFLWEPVNDVFEAPYADGNFDAGVVQHEYTHGLTNRYVAGGDALNTYQSGSMGEGWSDWYALNHLYGAGLATRAVVGEYVTGNAARGIRNYDYDRNPTNYGDLGYDITGPEVHADGEIWTATLWDLRKALIARYGTRTGAERAVRIITDAMPMTAPDPSMLDARDGILLAAQDRYAGRDTALIWSVFARRGMGASASTTGGDDTDPTPAFDDPVARHNGTVAGTVVDASTGRAVRGAQVFVGEYEARCTPLRQTAGGGHVTAPMVPGTYALTVRAPGYGVHTVRGVTLRAGATTRVRLALAPNLASAANGATVAASGEDPAQPVALLVDDTQATAWATPLGTTPYADGPRQTATVTLARPATITSVRVSAFKATTAPRFQALRDFTVEVSTDGVTYRTVRTGGFTSQPPRPVAPELLMRTFTLAEPAAARYVRFTVRSVLGETAPRAQVAELEVFGR